MKRNDCVLCRSWRQIGRERSCTVMIVLECEADDDFSFCLQRQLVRSLLLLFLTNGIQLRIVPLLVVPRPPPETRVIPHNRLSDLCHVQSVQPLEIPIRKADCPRTLSDVVYFCVRWGETGCSFQFVLCFGVKFFANLFVCSVY